jgi:predicted kinase
MSSKQSLFMLVGPYWSGKSTFADKMAAETHNLIVVSFETIYKDLLSVNAGADRGELVERVKETYNRQILTGLSEGKSVVADSSNMSESHLKNFIEIIASPRFGADVSVVFIDRPLSEKIINCPHRYTRLLIPGDPDGETVMDRSAQKFWSKLEGLVRISREAGASVECQIRTDDPDRQAILSRAFP